MVTPVITEGPAIGCAGRGRTCSFTGRPFFIFHYKDYCIMANPIWKDYNVLLGTGEWFNYIIRIDNVQVYAGKAYSKTGAADPVYIKINEIVADYLTRAIPNWESASPVEIPFAYAEVKVGSTTLDSATFTPDWSYNDDYVLATDGLCFPIDGWIANGQHLLYSAYGSVNPSMHIEYNDRHPDFLATDFNVDFLISGSTEDVALGGTIEGARVYAIPLASYSNLKEVTIGTKTWKVWPGCCRYVLHYINAYGGWDSLLIRGNGKQTDTLKRYTRKEPYNNATAPARGTDNYVNEIGAKYELHPGIMTEEQAARMFHLLNSCCVYLEDMQEGAIRPIVLTNATSEYKTWANQGHKLIEYTIEAELAQDRLRR